MRSTGDRAIHAALAGAWEEAVELNSAILSSNPADVDARNRLAYAFSQLGKYDEACETYHEILSRDPYNPIAQKNLLKCQQYQKSNHIPVKTTHKTYISPSLFVADAQKTRIVQLLNIAPQSVLQMVSVGEAVVPYRKGFELHIRNSEEVYLGKLPDDIGRKLISLLNVESPCECFVKDLGENELKIFIKWHE